MTVRRQLILALVVLCGLPTAASAQENIEYYGLDAIGSVRVVFDGSGTVLARTEYEPYGRIVSSTGNAPDRKFAQLFRDGEADLDYAEARSYQMRTGRFSSPDPLYDGVFEPQRWNRYAYALNNPLLLIDPTGLLAQGPKGTCSHSGFFAEMRSFCEMLFTLDSGWGKAPGQRTRPEPAEPAGRGGTRTSPPPPGSQTPTPPGPPGPEEPPTTSCAPTTFKVTGVGPRQAIGITAILQVPRAKIPLGGVAIDPSDFGVNRLTREIRKIFAGIRLHVDWTSAAKPNSYTPAIPRGLPTQGPYIPVDVLGPKSVRDEPGNQFDVYGYARQRDAFASTRMVTVRAVIPANSGGVTCPQ